MTIISRFLTLILNFALVLFTTRTWGSAGRGEIALVFANIAIIAILGNVFCGSTIAYHSVRYQREFLFSVSLAGAFITSAAGAMIFSAVSGRSYFLPMFIISFLLSLTTAFSSFWLGKARIMLYNFVKVSVPLFVFGLLLVLTYWFNRRTLDTYWLAYCSGALIVVIISIGLIFINEPPSKPVSGKLALRNILGYGIRNEFNYFIQFLNYRLSYYFISAIIGFGKLGIFSIVVSISEAVWIISNSLSANLYSEVINSKDPVRNRQQTESYARQSFLVSLLLLIPGILLPDSVYQRVFGAEFTGIRIYLLYMVPGIIAIAVSNLYGHYFAGRGMLKILRDKSLLGLAVSVILLPVLVKKFDLAGACISMDVSYIISAVYLWIRFRKETYPGVPAREQIK